MPTTHRLIAAAAAILISISHVSFAHADHVNWSQDVETALRSASQSGRLVLMKFTADWCGYCKKMERETFTRPAVAQTVNQQFVPVLVDADKHQELVKHLKIKGLPALLVVSPDMVILSRISGFQTEENCCRNSGLSWRHTSRQQDNRRVWPIRLRSLRLAPSPVRLIGPRKR